MRTRDGFRPQRAAIAAHIYQERIFQIRQVRRSQPTCCNVILGLDFIGSNEFPKKICRVPKEKRRLSPVGSRCPELVEPGRQFRLFLAYARARALGGFLFGAFLKRGYKGEIFLSPFFCKVSHRRTYAFRRIGEAVDGPREFDYCRGWAGGKGRCEVLPLKLWYNIRRNVAGISLWEMYEIRRYWLARKDR